MGKVPSNEYLIKGWYVVVFLKSSNERTALSVPKLDVLTRYSAETVTLSDNMSGDDEVLHIEYELSESYVLHIRVDGKEVHEEDLHGCSLEGAGHWINSWRRTFLGNLKQVAVLKFNSPLVSLVCEPSIRISGQWVGFRPIGRKDRVL